MNRYDSLEYNKGAEDQPRRKVIIDGMLDIDCTADTRHHTEVVELPISVSRVLGSASEENPY